MSIISRVALVLSIIVGIAVVATVGRVFAIFPRLKERMSQKAGTLSGGE